MRGNLALSTVAKRPLALRICSGTMKVPLTGTVVWMCISSRLPALKSSSLALARMRAPSGKRIAVSTLPWPTSAALHARSAWALLRWVNRPSAQRGRPVLLTTPPLARRRVILRSGGMSEPSRFSKVEAKRRVTGRRPLRGSFVGEISADSEERKRPDWVKKARWPPLARTLKMRKAEAPWLPRRSTAKTSKTWRPALALKLCGEEQGLKAPSRSSRQRKLEPGSEAAKPKLTLAALPLARTAPEGALVKRVLGAVAAIVQAWVAGTESTLPARSIARTAKL